MKQVVLMCAVVVAVLVPAACSNMKFIHVPAGQSILVATAPKAVAIPTPPPQRGFLYGLFHHRTPDVSEGGNTVADYYSIGVFCLQQGKNAEAINALEKATQMDPGFGDAWSQLAVAYENTGANDKALEAYKRSKAIVHP